MKRTVYFDTTKVVRIYFTPRKLCSLTFIPGEPSKQKYLFGFIPFGKTEPIVDGWENSYGFWYTDTEIKDREWCDVDDVNKEVFSKTNIEIRFLGGKNTINQYYDTDEEGKNKIDDIINSSGHPFEIIER